MRYLALTACSLLLCLALGPRAHAQSSGASVDIEAANQALDAGEYDRARSMVRVIIEGGSTVTRAERGEAFRILALSNFFQDKGDMARAAFLEFLRADPDAHLDPALVPPEAISLLEDVRARNSAELDVFRKKPRKKRYWALSFVPVAGQFQNAEPTKGVIFGAGMVLLLGANLSTYLVLKNYCDAEDRTCSSNGEDKTGTARSLQSANLLTGVGLISLYAYSVLDGYIGYRRSRDRERHSADYMSFDLVPTDGGASFAWSLGF